MLTLKEKFKIGFLVLGIFVVLSGIGLLLGFHRSIGGADAPRFEKGAYAEITGSGALDSYAPWMILIGVIALLVAHALREK